MYGVPICTEAASTLAWVAKLNEETNEAIREVLKVSRLALAHGLVKITGKPVKFYFEEREKQC